MIAIIDSGIGNVQSVFNALTAIKQDSKITTIANDIKRAEKIVFPGVGAFADGMKTLNKSNLIDTLSEEVFVKKKPFLGICLGMQLLAEVGYEDGKHKGLGWIKGSVRKLVVKSASLKLPHIGWNNVRIEKNAELFKNLKNPTFYFVHSYVFKPKNQSVIAATCKYGQTFVASIQYKNIYGTQFHPEKSQKNGLQVLCNFAKIKS